MKRFIILGFLGLFISACYETVDTSKYKEELHGRKIKKLTAAEIISFGHKEAVKIAHDTTFESSKMVNQIHVSHSLEECKTNQEKEFFEMSIHAMDQIFDGVDLSNPVMYGDEILVVVPGLASDSTIQVKYIYLSKAEVIKKMPERY